VRVGQAFLDVSKRWRILCWFLALRCLALLVQLLQLLFVADASEVENFKGRGEVIVLFLGRFFLLLLSLLESIQ
jgi:hypothetical protein